MQCEKLKRSLEHRLKKKKNRSLTHPTTQIRTSNTVNIPLDSTGSEVTESALNMNAS